MEYTQFMHPNNKNDMKNIFVLIGLFYFQMVNSQIIVPKQYETILPHLLSKLN